MRVVIDVNVLLQSIGKSSKLRTIWTAYLKEKYKLLISNSILFEYEEVINEKTSISIAQNVVKLIAEAVNTEHISIYYEWDAIIQDPDDNKYFDTAVSGRADFIVTNDKHFNIVRSLNFPQIRIISGKEFLRLLEVKQV